MLSVLKKSNISDIDDKNILGIILHDFSKNDYTLITPQENLFLNLHSYELWAPYLIYRYKFKKFPEQRIVTDFPIYLLIEPVSACNLRCIMCFQIDESFTSNNNFMGNMDIDFFKKIIDEAAEGGTKAITLASRGEPTLHPKLGEMLEYCSGKFFELKINTNGIILNDKLIHQILKSGVTDVVFSIDSYTKKDYESIRIQGVFETVLNNVKRFKEIKEKFYPNSKCATRVSGVRVDKKQDPNAFKEFWKEYVDHVVVVEMENRWDTYNNPKEIAGTGACNYLWERMYVWYDGLCNPCDVDYKSELQVGSIKENSIKDIWTGEKYQKLRKLHLDGNRNSCYPCDRCPIGD
jgi:radical SAM protein with 4Fe4S-binding SPASM domain